VDKRRYYSWILYDWANSAYATIVLAGFFPIIFSEYYASVVSDNTRTLILGVANSSASLLLIILAPILGLISDIKNNKKNFLVSFALLGILSTFSLAYIGEDNYALAAIFFSISLLGFMLSNVFYDSMLLNFKNKSSYNSISSYGYAIGYLGGGISFVLSIYFLLINQDSSLDIVINKKIVFIFAASWWLIFMLPMLLYWRDNEQIISSTKMSLSNTFRDIYRNKAIFYFLLAYWVYIDGVDTIIRMAVNYGLVLGFTSDNLLFALLITQFVAFPGTLLTNWIAKLRGATFGITVCLVIYLLITFISYQLSSITEFYFVAVLIGLVQGGIQALSRSYYSSLVPEGRDSEFFGVYNMLGKFAALIGPIVVGFVTFLSDDARLGILSISVFFIIGFLIFQKALKT